MRMPKSRRALAVAGLNRAAVGEGGASCQQAPGERFDRAIQKAVRDDAKSPPMGWHESEQLAGVRESRDNL